MTPLPNKGEIYLKTSAGTILTTAFAFWGPLTSTYSGFEVDAAEIKNTTFFYLPGFTQGRLATKLVLQGHYIWVDASESYLITGLKDWGSHTELVGLRQSVTEAFVASTAAGLISEYAFASSAALVTDAQGRNNLTNTNTVTYSSDKPAEVLFNIGSALFVAASSQRLEIADASQVQLDITGSLFIACRFKLTSLPGGTPFYVISKSSGAPDWGYHLSISTTGRVALDLSADGATLTQALGVTLLAISTWYSVCVVSDGTDIRIYLNGALDANGASNPKAFTGGIFNNAAKFILSGREDGTRYFDGKLGHVFIGNQAKTAAQVLNWHLTDVWE